MTKVEFFEEWSRIHGGAEIKGIVRGWLEVSFVLTKPIISLRISPNFLTLLSVLLGALFLGTIEGAIAILFLVLSLLLDGIDGTVAIISKRTSKFGAALDAFADRIVESLWAFGFYLMGAPWQLVMTAWLAAFIQEYLRARAAGLGIREVLLVTPAERPVRATFIFIALVARAFEIDLILAIAFGWAILQTFSALWLFTALRSQLQQSQR